MLAHENGLPAAARMTYLTHQAGILMQHFKTYHDVTCQCDDCLIGYAPHHIAIKNDVPDPAHVAAQINAMARKGKGGNTLLRQQRTYTTDKDAS
jgi:hypothetical protein